ncbi:MAG: hypothetical protein M3332_09935 [Actinomycetota bacterium]|nr:hypothetical protein [Actinomycetota bacterium]
MDNLPSSSQSSKLFLLCDASLFAGLSGGGQREPLVTTAAVTDSGKGQVADDQGGFLIGVMLRTADDVASAAPLTASLFECSASNGVATGFRGKMAAETKHMGPSPQSPVAGFPVGGVFMVGAATENPTGAHQTSGVGGGIGVLPMVSVGMRVEMCPVASVALVAYLAR